MAAVKGALSQVALPADRKSGDQAFGVLFTRALGTFALILVGGRSDLLEFELAGITKELIQRHLDYCNTGGRRLYKRLESVLYKVSDPVAQLDRAGAF